MTPEEGLRFVEEHGVVLESVRGPVPALAIETWLLDAEREFGVAGNEEVVFNGRSPLNLRRGVLDQRISGIVPSA